MNHKIENPTKIQFNQGRALLHLASMYPTLLEVILELVQNALDCDVRANRIWIKIDYKTRTVYVRDNGAGITVTKFNQALGSVAEPGRKGEGSLGQFGLGLIAALGKCVKFIFTSCPAPHSDLFQEWIFDTEAIVNQRHELVIPTRPRQDLTLREHARGKMAVKWRSEMVLQNFTIDQFISRVPIDALIGGIQDRYASVMRRNKVAISITIIDENGHKEERPNVTAPEFRGRKLPEQKLANDDAGETLFRMFVSPKTKRGERHGRVLVGVRGNEFRFPFHYLARSVADLLNPEAVLALQSGLFEGEILGEKIKLHPSRRTFEKDDALIGFCISVDEWFEQFGQKFLDEAKRSRQEERFQELGLRSMKVLEQLLKGNEALLNIVRSFGHAVPGEGPDKERKPERDRSQNPEPRQPSEQPEEGPPRTKPDKPDLKVRGPCGRNQKLVSREGFGLRFSHEAMEGSPDLWKLDTSEGVLSFNIRHPLWIACDERSDVVLMKLQETVAIQALTLEIMPANLRHAQRQALDEFNVSFADWLIKGDRARGSAPGKKKDI